MKSRHAERTVSFKEQLKYKFDRQISGGTIRLMLWLAAMSIGVISIAALVLALGIHPEDSTSEDYAESFWSTLNLAMDPGGIEESGWAYRGVMIFISIFGILVVSTIIGVLTSGIENKLDNLRRGRSLVIEQDHTVILGWSTKIAAAVEELVIANESRERGVIVILAEKDKVEMEDYLRDHIADMKTTEIICRSGDPCDLADLAIVRPERARSAILMAGASEDGDALVFKRAMALMRIAERTGTSFPVVAEVMQTDNHDAIASLGNIQIVQPAELVTRVLLQGARQPGLSIVYEELLSFKGCEVYFHSHPDLAGRTFGEIVMSFTKAAALGIRTHDGTTRLNPPTDIVFNDNDELIVVAEDDSAIGLPVSPMSFDSKHINPEPTGQTSSEGHVIIGWHRWANILLKELDAQLMPGSIVEVLYDPKYSKGPSQEDLSSFTNITVSVSTGNTTRRRTLESLDLTNISEIMLLSYRDELNPQSADSNTLLTLVHLRTIVQDCTHKIGIATELLDAQNRELADRGHEDDFIASEELVSDLMVQLSENPMLNNVFSELLTAEGAEFYLKHALNYVAEDAQVPYGAIVQSGLQRGELVIGILKRSKDALTPNLAMAIDKSELVTLGPTDAVIVLADDD
tara:strand:- start:292 stop:2187 length:1896 start_codon:yes stop_codon:yes gene_type:complete